MKYIPESKKVKISELMPRDKNIGRVVAIVLVFIFSFFFFFKILFF